jgi:hypothetical protein
MVKIKTRRGPRPKVELPIANSSGISQRLVAGMRQEPLWDLYRDGVTQGFLEAFKACPEKARLLAVEGLAPLRTGGALSFGSLFHEALDVLYTYAMQEGEFPDVDVVLHSLEERDRVKINEADGEDTGVLLQEMELNYGMAEPLLKAYLERWSKDLSLYNWQALEQKFGEEGDGCRWLDSTANGGKGEWIRVRGKMDGVFKMNGNLWLFETKTKARIEDPALMDRLGYDLQVNLYLWAVRRLYGERPRGAVYNLVRRPQLQQGKHETVHQFCERIRADIASRSDFYFTRLNAAITPQDQLFWEGEFDDLMRQVVKWYNGEFHYRNSHSCSSPWACQYLPICGRGDRSRFRRKDDVYPELTSSAGEEE